MVSNIKPNNAVSIRHFPELIIKWCVSVLCFICVSASPSIVPYLRFFNFFWSYCISTTVIYTRKSITVELALQMNNSVTAAAFVAAYSAQIKRSAGRSDLGLHSAATTYHPHVSVTCPFHFAEHRYLIAFSHSDLPAEHNLISVISDKVHNMNYETRKGYTRCRD